jgi:tRNA(Arg) A34 adenosine deaminase TadA
MIDDTDRRHLRRCLELAREALEAGDEPFGSVLVAGNGTVLHEDRNRERSVDPTYHPEVALARWATSNLSEDRRGTCTVYTSGEHCPMCSAAHGWAGLGRIVFIHSAGQLADWFSEWGVEPGPVRQLGIGEVLRGVSVDGPADELVSEVRQMHRQAHEGTPLG